MWVKICGIRDVETARRVQDCGPDAIGLNFYSRSRRYVDRSIASEIADSVGGQLECVGLFVNASPQQIAATLETCSLSAVQIHGDETPQQLLAIQSVIGDCQLLRALRCDAAGLKTVSEYLQQCQRLDVRIDRLLLDAAVPGQYGGTGRVGPWQQIADEYQFELWPPLVLAGGLNPENVASAIECVRPAGVDTASGVEEPAGIKDEDRCRRFVQAARGAN